MKIAKARLISTGRIVVGDCPYCHQMHVHQRPVGDGIREAHCFQGQYLLLQWSARTDLDRVIVVDVVTGQVSDTEKTK